MAIMAAFSMFSWLCLWRTSFIGAEIHSLKPGHRDTSTEAERDTNQGYRSWIANRNDPISTDSGSNNLTLDHSGALTINRQNEKPITLYSPVKPQVTNKNTILTLSDSGNLVLLELHPNGFSKQVL
ncbi:hypothetical protein QN277_002343 [Acacia crassicarpa]|uniref:Bulb-type lectin domain-containing protein n=1 Tax=Acacia crassicarpa TaxID=499986 RepID=A0AAE1N949_9FABA|nr:hypothetical protein QN277_002343 [Acacia crassicarpa]